jgi:hypothetical protein
VQASDEYVGVRNARVVLVDWELVRAVMTASWLNQMGWDDVHVLQDFNDLAFESGPRPKPAVRQWKTTRDVAGATVLDLSTSLRFHYSHVPGAWWGVRSRLSQAKEKMPPMKRLVLTSEDGILAHLTAPEAAELFPQVEIEVLDGGNAGWTGPTESGHERATTERDDVWYKPYDHASDYKKHAQDYLSWEVALVDQIKRDPTIRFRAYD